ncbi:hypothetical protein HY637_03950 [Candidatus Woesearchaeota archaeon]|nr:hypothetical protein [Candidatus Woesearchaeota archaeon]
MKYFERLIVAFLFLETFIDVMFCKSFGALFATSANKEYLIESILSTASSSISNIRVTLLLLNPDNKHVSMHSSKNSISSSKNLTLKLPHDE